jgi:monoamine oxidase
LRDPDKKAEPIEDKEVHNGALRLQGGMASLIQALATDLPQDRIHLGHILTGLRDDGDHVTLTFGSNGATIEVEARRVILAVPPRLLEEHVRFQPDLDEATREAMRGAETWMAAQAKVVIGYERPLWRESGESGNAFVTHEQAVVGEIFDACDITSTKAALGGFLALSPELREAFRDGLPLLMASQMVQVFGSALEGGEQHYQDWANEPFTCSTRDRSALGEEHRTIANPMLRRALWDGKLYLGSSETAAQGAGYLEGALGAAQRIDRAIGRTTRDRSGLEKPAVADGGAGSINAASLARFNEWVSAQSDAAFDDYRRRLNQSLAAQQREQLTQRAMLESIEEVYRKSLDVLNTLALDMSGVAVERGRSALMPEVQRPFRDVMQTLLDDVIAFNQTSCALSNFPDEHRLSKDYVQTILRDIAAAWQEFSLSANRLLLAKAEITPHPHQAGDHERSISP